MVIDMQKAKGILRGLPLPTPKPQRCNESYVTNCVIISRNADDAPLFYLDGMTAKVFLDGYAIIPIERYESLLSP